MPSGDKQVAKTHEQFLIDFESKQPILFNNIKIVSNYCTAKLPVLIKTKFGDALVNPCHLLQGCKPTIMSAINKNEYFKNQLLDANPSFFDNHEIISDYEGTHEYLIIKNKYGICKITPADLLQRSVPSIKSAINPKEYWINQVKEVHGDLYDYSLVEYVNTKTKVKIISPYQIFEITPNNHLKGRGCSIVGNLKVSKFQQINSTGYNDSDWITNGLKSKNFDSFKIYVIKCFNDAETFYKIGKTFRTVKKRFKLKKGMPYKYEIIKEIIFEKTFEKGEECCKFERELQIKYKEFKYIPKIKFDGMCECFQTLPNLFKK